MATRIGVVDVQGVVDGNENNVTTRQIQRNQIRFQVDFTLTKHPYMGYRRLNKQCSFVLAMFLVRQIEEKKVDQILQQKKSEK